MKFSKGFATQTQLATILGITAVAFAANTASAGPVEHELAPKVMHGTRYSNAGFETAFAQSAAKARPTTDNGITYHGGPIMLGTTNVYYIWYGSWEGNTAKTLLPAFASALSGSSYYNINTSYTGSGGRVSNSVNFAGEITNNYSRGKSLTDSDVKALVSEAINGGDPLYQSGTLPYDPNGVYFVLTSADVAESSGFCSQYCGWHTYQSLNGGAIKYSFVGNADRCLSACSMQTVSPNGNAGADAMASIIAHELEEAVTDPQLNAWYDRRGYENADKCAWTFGSTSNASNGSKYNVVLNGMKFLIQQNWVNASGGYCSMSY